MSAFRTNTPDAPERREAKSVKPGTLPEGRFAVLDHKGRVRGHVGPKATEATVSRFGVHGAFLDTDDNGRTCWRGKAIRP
jgi:hypothetical protein